MPIPEDLICRCYFVTQTEIVELVKEHKMTTVGEVTEACSAGGGCGNCQPEIAEIISEITGKEVDPYAD
jgi:NAD(P)H-nitrite reductase large subunit